MNEQEYLKRVRTLLNPLPESEREEAIAYVREYIEEALNGGAKEDLSTLPSPEEFARTLCQDLGFGQPAIPAPLKPEGVGAGPKTSGPARTALIVLAVIFSPVLLVLALCLVLAAGMVMMAAVLLFAAFVLLGLMCALCSFVCLVTIPMLVFKTTFLLGIDTAGVLFNCGLSLIGAALSILAGCLAVKFFKAWIPAAAKLLGQFCLCILRFLKNLFLSVWQAFRKDGRSGRPASSTTGFC